MSSQYLGPKYVSLAKAAEHLHVTERSVHNYIGRGLFPAYRFRGERGHFVDLNEVDAAIADPANAGAVRPGTKAFGPNAVIIEKPRRAVVVPINGGAQ